MRVPFLDLRAPIPGVQAEIDRAVRGVQDRGIFVLGPEVQAFEAEFAAYVGVRHCVGVGSGTDALALLLRACGVAPGDEVIVPAYTAVATWMAVTMIGAVPVGVDCAPGSFMMDAEHVAAVVTPRTRACVAVHLLGGSADIPALRETLRPHGVLLLEDAAQAHGALLGGLRLGGLASGASFSFYPTKNLGAHGDGGAVVTDDDDIADAVRLMRSYGWRERNVSLINGVNSRLDEMQAAILRVKLRTLDDWNERRRAHAETYRTLLAGSVAEAANFSDDCTPVWHLFPVVVGARRDIVRERLQSAGIDVLVHYDPLPPVTPAFAEDPTRYPAAIELSQSCLSLPMSPHLTSEQIEFVATTLIRIVEDIA